MESEKEIKKKQKRNEKEMKKNKKFEVESAWQIVLLLFLTLCVAVLVMTAIMFVLQSVIFAIRGEKEPPRDKVETVSVEGFRRSENGEFWLGVMFDSDNGFGANGNQYLFYCFNEEGGKTLRSCDVARTVIYETLSDEETPYAVIIMPSGVKAFEEVQLYLPAKSLVLEEITSLNE